MVKLKNSDYFCFPEPHLLMCLWWSRFFSLYTSCVLLLSFCWYSYHSFPQKNSV